MCCSAGPGKSKGYAMQYFILGFLCCWVLGGILVLLADRLDILFQHLANTATLPLIILLAPFLLMYSICMVVYAPFRYVVHPVTQERFDTANDRMKGKLRKISGSLYYCVDKNAKRFWNRLFFVRIRKEREKTG